MKNELDKLIDPIFHKDGKFNGNELMYVLQYLNSEDNENEKISWSARLESAFAEKFNVNFAISHNSGTSTLHSCLHAAGIGAGDEVIVPTYTVICLAFAVIHQNAIPVFVDSNPETFNMDPVDIEKKITPKTKAIIAVHMHGLPCDMDKIMGIAKKHNLVVIEDCAQSVLAEYKGQLTGSIGDMASFSFETKKHMTSGQGGMVISNESGYAEKVRKHSGLGYKTLTARQGMSSLLPEEFQNPDFKRHDSLGYNYRLPEICAALALAQFERIEDLVERRKSIAALFLDALSNCSWIIPQKVPQGYNHSYWSFAALYYGIDEYGVSWREFYNKFNENGGDGFFGALSLQHKETAMIEKPFYGSYIPSDIEIYQDKFNYDVGICPVAESIQPKMMIFKCGYRNMEKAKNIANALTKTIIDISTSKRV
jgi:perosamine synthetase